MMNNTFSIVSYISNKKGTEKIFLIFDSINKRIIEKWIGYQLVKDKSKFVITDRFIYTYNKFNILSKILEVEKGNDDREYSYLSDNNEYCHSINRKINQLDLNNKLISNIIYSRTNWIGSGRKDFFLRNINLITKEVEDRVFKTRINYILKKNKLYVYKYKKNDFSFLNKIVEYKVLIDFRIINQLINKTDIPILMSIPDLFLKVKVKEDLNIINNKEKRLHYYEQDYFSRFTFDDNNFYFFIQDLILTEDLFVNEMNKIHEMYNQIK
jgi:hypothetical protein